MAFYPGLFGPLEPENRWAMLQKSLQYYLNSFQGLSRHIWMLSLVMLINRAGAMVLPFLTIYLTTELGFPKAQTGWVMAAFGLGAVAGAYLGGKLTDNIGYYRVQLYSLILTGFMFFSLIFIRNIGLLCLAVFTTSLIADAFRPANMTAIAAYSKPDNRTRSIALMRLAVNLGYAIGPAIGGFLVTWLGYSWLFIIDGSTCLLAAGVFFYFLPERMAPASSDEQPLDTLSEAKGVWRDRRYLAFILITIVTAGVFLQLISILPVYWKEEVGYTEAQIGLLFTLNCLIVAFTEMPIIFALEKKGNLYRLMALGVLLMGLAYFVYLPGTWSGMVILSVLALTFGEIFNMPFGNTYALNLAPESQRGQYMALYSMAWSTAHIAAPLAGFQTIEHFGYSTLWIANSVLAALCVGAYLWLGRAKNKIAPVPKSLAGKVG